MMDSLFDFLKHLNEDSSRYYVVNRLLEDRGLMSHRSKQEYLEQLRKEGYIDYSDNSGPLGKTSEDLVQGSNVVNREIIFSAIITDKGVELIKAKKTFPWQIVAAIVIIVLIALFFFVKK